MKNRKKQKLPTFETREQAAQFWDTHSSVDYLDDLDKVKLEIDPRIKSPRDLSPRCPLDQKIMLSRFIDLYTTNGHVKLEKLEELYCREGHYARLAPESEKLVREIELALKRVRQKAEKIAA